jgi:hypothetical protein
VGKPLTLFASLGPDDREEFLREANKNDLEEMVKASGPGGAIFILWSIVDYIYVPTQWLLFLILRIGVVLPTFAYTIAVHRGVFRYGPETKLINTLTTGILCSWMIGAAPEENFILFPCGFILMVLSTASSRTWLPREFQHYSAIIYAASAIIWHRSSLPASEVGFLHFILLTALAASAPVIAARNGQAVSLFLSKKEIVRREREKAEQMLAVIEVKSAESERNAYLAHHLGLFLHDIKHVLVTLDDLGEGGSLEAQELGRIVKAVRQSSSLSRSRIETFLSRVKAIAPRSEQISVGYEIEAVVPIIEYDASRNNVGFELVFAQKLDDLRVSATPGSISIVVFNMTRNALASIDQARQKFAGPTFAGKLRLLVQLTEESVIINIEDNGVGPNDKMLADFASNEPLDTPHGEGIEIGALAMRHEAAENDFSVSLAPRLGGGAIATLIIPRLATMREDLDTTQAPKESEAAQRARKAWGQVA